MGDATITEEFQVVTRKDCNPISGWYTSVQKARAFQKSWLTEGHHVDNNPRNRFGWVHHGVTNGGRVEILTDVVIIKRTTIAIDEQIG